jgi:hypothetical protein
MPVIMPGVKIPTTNKVVIPTSITISIGGGPNPIVGFIQDLTFDTTRRIERVRELSATRAGRIREQVPAPEDITVTGTGFCLYESNVLKQIAYQGTVQPITDVWFALTNQCIPFDVFIEETHPLTNEGFLITLEQCWLARYSHPIRIGDLMISETFDLQPQGVITQNTNNSGNTPTEADVIKTTP